MKNRDKPMDEKTLEALHEKLITQRDHPGGVCPSEARVLDYVLGNMDETSVLWMESSLGGCPECKNLVEELQADLVSFRQRKASVLEQLQQRLDTVLDRGEAGAAAWLTGKLSELAGMADGGRQLLARLLTGIGDLVASGAEPLLQPAPGVRAAGGVSLNAPVEDESGAPLLDQNGVPMILVFDLIRSEIETDGRLVLDVSTTGLNMMGDRNVLVKVVLAAGNTALELPAEKVFNNGRVTIVAMIPGAGPVAVIPAAAIEITAVVSDR